MKSIIVGLISWVLLCFPAWGDTSLWKINKNGKELYLGGTCHILRSSDFPLPDAFDRAYKESDIIVFETDIGKLNTPEVQQKILSKMIYGDGTGLKEHLSPATYDKLNEFCEKAGLPLVSLDAFKPAMVMITLLMIELKKMGVSEDGVDMHYYRQSMQDNKPVRQLETVDEQIDMLSSMGAGNEDAFVLHSLEEMNRTKEIFDQLIDHWKQGHSEDLARFYIEPVKKDYPELYRSLLVARNEAWLPKIERFMESPEKEFVLVGFLHLVGEEGIIEQLRKLGYRVEKL